VLSRGAQEPGRIWRDGRIEDEIWIFDEMMRIERDTGIQGDTGWRPKLEAFV
jgi:hypothetical protein